MWAAVLTGTVDDEHALAMSESAGQVGLFICSIYTSILAWIYEDNSGRGQHNGENA
jgi:hypothetical protein